MSIQTGCTYPIPVTGFLRLKQIVGNPKADPAIPPIIPVSKSTWWAGVKTGRFPQPVKLGDNITAWRVEDIRKLMDWFQPGEQLSIWPDLTNSITPLLETNEDRHD